jgi:hypothetical protein
MPHARGKRDKTKSIGLLRFKDSVKREKTKSIGLQSFNVSATHSFLHLKLSKDVGSLIGRS